MEAINYKFLASLKKEVKRCETLSRMRKDEKLAVEFDMRNGVQECRIILSSYIPRNFLCDKVYRRSPKR